MTHHPSRCVYARHLGYYEYSDDNERVPAMVTVMDAGFGFNVFIMSVELDHLKWLPLREDALEFAVDASRELAAQHEISQYSDG